jgi:hypothetical protein
MQLSHADPTPIAGTIAGSGPHRYSKIANPRVAQVDNLHVNGATADGTWTAILSDSMGQVLATAAYVAVSKTAAQIAAGWAAAILADYEWLGYINGVSGAAVINTDEVAITYIVRNGPAYVLTYTGPNSTPVVTTTTAPGFTRVAPGRILQASAGTYTTTYTDAAVALGVVYRNGDLRLPIDPNDTSLGYEGPAEIPLLVEGEINVQVISGITVAIGEKVYFEPVAATWSNVTTGSHVLVEGAQWRTAGTGVQTCSIRLPSET